MTRGPWFSLCSGRRFHPWSPQAEDIHIEDIAGALSKLCRFNGHCLEFYSVAEHSVHTSYQVPAELALCALLHDATEAYIGDLITPIKKNIPAFEEVESIVWLAIAARFNLPWILPPEVYAADRTMLLIEARDLLHPVGEPKPWGHANPPITPVTLGNWTARVAEEKFLSRFHELVQTG
jgi:uncharacterized protein